MRSAYHYHNQDPHHQENIVIDMLVTTSSPLLLGSPSPHWVNVKGSPFAHWKVPSSAHHDDHDNDQWDDDHDDSDDIDGVDNDNDTDDDW